MYSNCFFISQMSNSHQEITFSVPGGQGYNINYISQTASGETGVTLCHSLVVFFTFLSLYSSIDQSCRMLPCPTKIIIDCVSPCLKQWAFDWASHILRFSSLIQPSKQRADDWWCSGGGRCLYVIAFTPVAIRGSSAHSQAKLGDDGE